jgi:hypothetical protein
MGRWLPILIQSGNVRLQYIFTVPKNPVNVVFGSSPVLHQSLILALPECPYMDSSSLASTLIV